MGLRPRLRWVFDCARVLQDPLFAQRNRRAWTPAEGLEARPTSRPTPKLIVLCDQVDGGRPAEQNASGGQQRGVQVIAARHSDRLLRI